MRDVGWMRAEQGRNFAKPWALKRRQRMVEGLQLWSPEGSRGRGENPTMAYVENGVVKSKRTIWRLSIISDFFWAVVNFIGVFFMTMFSMDKTNEYKKGSGSSKKWDGGPGGGGPGGGPGRGPPGGGPHGPRFMSDLRSNDHSSLPACGSCCGG